MVQITFEDGEVDPNGERIEVDAGQPIDLEVTADEPGEIHVHSDPEQEIAYDAGTETIEIQIDRPGVVEVESHDLDQVIVQLEVTVTGGVLEAHGIGGQADLPISLGLAISGAVAALVISFTVLVVAWRTPRYATGLDERRDRRRPSCEEPPTVLRVVRAGRAPADRHDRRSLFTAMDRGLRRGPADQPVLRHRLRLAVGRRRLRVAALRTGVAGDQPDADDQRRPRAGSPAATPSRASSTTRPGSATGRQRSVSTRSCGWSWSTGRPPTSGRSASGARSTSPRCSSAARSSAPASTRTPTRSRSTRPWSARCRSSDRDDEGRLALRSPLAGAATIPSRPGLVAVVAVLFGSTAFDSFRESTFWIRTIQEASVTGYTLNNLALLGFCLGAGLIFAPGAP